MIGIMTKINIKTMQDNFLEIIANESKDDDDYDNVLLLKQKLNLKMNKLKT